uniref:Triggering receptor expressed on myeloid cells 1 n=1 Tax=Panthera leo TaxID=9689 RepID=A0A8C8WJ08_PANLE
MKKAGLRGLLWMVFISELQAENESTEEKFIKEGETLNVNCPFSTEKYSYSQKAWQKLIDGRKPVTLALTKSTSGDPSQVREGRYFLEDIPSEAILHVQMTNLQVEDSGLYRCVIYYLSKEPDVLSPLFHLVVIKDPLSTAASDKNHTWKLQISTFPPTTTRAQGTLVDRPRTVTKLPPKSTADLSSPGFGVNITNVTDVTSYVFRIPSCRRRGETKVTARWRDLDHSLLLKCHALLQPEGLAAENGTSQENQQRQSGSRARQPPGVSPGHSTPREADLTFQELTGMPSSPNKYHTPLCSVEETSASVPTLSSCRPLPAWLLWLQAGGQGPHGAVRQHCFCPR